MTSDFLVIGTGIAGLSFALDACRHGTVTVISKGKIDQSNTAWAQGGIASVLPDELRDEGDDVEAHIADTLNAGAGLCRDRPSREILRDPAQPRRGFACGACLGGSPTA